MSCIRCIQCVRYCSKSVHWIVINRYKFTQKKYGSQRLLGVVMHVLQRKSKRLCRFRSVLKGVSYRRGLLSPRQAYLPASLPREWVQPAVPLPQGPGSAGLRALGGPRLFGRGEGRVVTEILPPLADSHVFKVLFSIYDRVFRT